MKPNLFLPVLLLASCVSIGGEKLSTPLSSSPNAIVISNDLGGSTKAYLETIEELKTKNFPIILDGPCMSACTLLLQASWNLNVCATSRATLHFHMPYYTDPVDGAILVSSFHEKESLRVWKEKWLGSFSPRLNAMLSIATRLERIPNPSATGDYKSTLSIRATSVVKEC